MSDTWLILSILVVFLILLLSSIFAIDNQWKKDCDKMGRHLSGDIVYICAREKP